MGSKKRQERLDYINDEIMKEYKSEKRFTDHKIKLKLRQIQVLGKSTGQINNTGYEWYIGS